MIWWATLLCQGASYIPNSLPSMAGAFQMGLMLFTPGFEGFAFQLHFPGPASLGLFSWPPGRLAFSASSSPTALLGLGNAAT